MGRSAGSSSSAGAADAARARGTSERIRRNIRIAGSLPVESSSISPAPGRPFLSRAGASWRDRKAGSNYPPTVWGRGVDLQERVGQNHPQFGTASMTTTAAVIGSRPSTAGPTLRASCRSTRLARRPTVLRSRRGRRRSAASTAGSPGHSCRRGRQWGPRHCVPGLLCRNPCGSVLPASRRSDNSRTGETAVPPKGELFDRACRGLKPLPRLEERHALSDPVAGGVVAQSDMPQAQKVQADRQIAGGVPRHVPDLEEREESRGRQPAPDAQIQLHS